MFTYINLAISLSWWYRLYHQLSETWLDIYWHQYDML